MELSYRSILIIHALILFFYYIVRFLCGPMSRRRFIGMYLILMPLGFALWKDPSLWLVAVLSIAGLLLVFLSGKEDANARSDIGQA